MQRTCNFANRMSPWLGATEDCCAGGSPASVRASEPMTVISDSCCDGVALPQGGRLPSGWWNGAPGMAPPSGSLSNDCARPGALARRQLPAAAAAWKGLGRSAAAATLKGFGGDDTDLTLCCAACGGEPFCIARGAAAAVLPPPWSSVIAATRQPACR